MVVLSDSTLHSQALSCRNAPLVQHQKVKQTFSVFFLIIYGSLNFHISHKITVTRVNFRRDRTMLYAHSYVATKALILKEWGHVVSRQYHEIRLQSEIPLLMSKMQQQMVFWWHKVKENEWTSKGKADSSQSAMSFAIHMHGQCCNVLRPYAHKDQSAAFAPVSQRLHLQVGIPLASCT